MADVLVVADHFSMLEPPLHVPALVPVPIQVLVQKQLVVRSSDDAVVVLESPQVVPQPSLSPSNVKEPTVKNNATYH